MQKLKFIIAGLMATGLFTGALMQISAQAQQLDSTTYRILDPSFDSGGSVSTSTNYSLLTNLNPLSDARLTSGTYAAGTGFPNGIQANVPLIRCAETNTTSGTTTCTDFPNAFGAQGECGSPGCYDRAKIEIDKQGNPYDTLFLVSVTDNSTGIVYYITSAHILATTYTISDYQTICAFQGVDASNPGCSTNAALERYNVTGLHPNTTYTVKARAFSGNFTETQYGPTVNFTTQVASISLDLDIGTTSAASNSAPYVVDLGKLTTGTPKIATNRIWLDIDTNAFNGSSTFAQDANAALKSGTYTIPSQAEDLTVDSGADGGYGLKTESATQTRLGPLIKSTNYDTGGTNIVGSLTTGTKLIFSTDTVSTDRGPITAGRAGVQVQALAVSRTPAGTYTDNITFTLVGTF